MCVCVCVVLLRLCMCVLREFVGGCSGGGGDGWIVRLGGVRACALRECGRHVCLLCVCVSCGLVWVALPAVSFLGAPADEIFLRCARHGVLDLFLHAIPARRALQARLSAWADACLAASKAQRSAIREPKVLSKISSFTVTV